MARFLNFYPQYTLEDLRALPARDFLYLVGGMLDAQAPEATASSEEKVARAMRAQNERHHAEAVRRLGGR